MVGRQSDSLHSVQPWLHTGCRQRESPGGLLPGCWGARWVPVPHFASPAVEGLAVGHSGCRITCVVPGSHWLWVVHPQPGQSCLHGVTRSMGWCAAQGRGGRRCIMLQEVPWAGGTELWDAPRTISAVPHLLKPGTPLMLGRPSCSLGLVCFGDEAVGWRRLQFCCQGRGWVAAGRSSSVVLSFPRLIPAPVREAGAEKGSSISIPCSRFSSSPAQTKSRPGTEVLPRGKLA